MNLITGYADRFEFYWCNALGSTLLIFSDVYRGSWFSVGIGLFWISISLITIFNKLILPHKALNLTIGAALIFFGSGLIHSIIFIEPLNDKLFTCLGMISTAFCVVIYGLFASKRLNLMFYLLIGIVIKLVMMTALFNDFNFASFSLQGYSILIATIGIYRESNNNLLNAKNY